MGLGWLPVAVWGGEGRHPPSPPQAGHQSWQIGEGQFGGYPVKQVVCHCSSNRRPFCGLIYNFDKLSTLPHTDNNVSLRTKNL